MSSTHAGGIQPSQSFFRPARPVQQPQYSPQPSLSGQHDDYPLATVPPSRESHSTWTHTAEPLLPALPRTSSRVRTSIDRVFGLSLAQPTTPDEERAEAPTVARHSKVPPPSAPPAHFFTADILHVSASRSSFASHVSAPSPTPPPSFIAVPPLHHPYPPARTPCIPAGATRPLRRYQVHPSHNRFFFCGRLLTGGDSPWAFVLSLSLALFLTGLWFSTTCVFWWHYSRATKAIVIIGAYLAALVLSTMIATATTDPGILPRNLDPDPPYPATSPSDGAVRAPLPRDLRVRNQVVRVKYCATCNIYRPPRSSHCKMCDNCVDDCDHHCQWVNNCIGRRNYTVFFALISSATLTLVLVIVTSALHIWQLTQNKSFRHALSDRKGIGSAVCFSLSILVLWPIGALFAYHFRLLMLNSTTIEQIRNQAHRTIDPGGEKLQNPFSHGTRRRNIAAVLCRPAGFSWLDANAVVTEDRRTINPGRFVVNGDVTQDQH